MRIWCLMIWGGAEVVMLALGSGCKYRSSLAERFGCTETMINQLLADSYQNPISEWQVKTSSGHPLMVHSGDLYNYFIIYYNVIIIEIKCTINAMPLNRPTTIPSSAPVHGKIVFHETGPWCQKGWGALFCIVMWMRLPSRAEIEEYMLKPWWNKHKFLENVALLEPSS